MEDAVEAGKLDGFGCTYGFWCAGGEREGMQGVASAETLLKIESAGEFDLYEASVRCHRHCKSGMSAGGHGR